jgi:hypothetical protein
MSKRYIAKPTAIGAKARADTLTASIECPMLTPQRINVSTRSIEAPTSHPPSSWTEVPDVNFIEPLPVREHN